jgi:hypothetical protein
MEKETIKTLADLVNQLGFAVLVTVYFLYRDWRYTDKQTAASEAIAVNLALLNENLSKENK